MWVKRSTRQLRVLQWVRQVFGDNVADTTSERASRVVEEALELGQAAGLSREDTVAIAFRVFSRPKGDIRTELGDVGLTILALAEQQWLSADTCEVEALERALNLDPEHLRARHNAKVADGVAIPMKTA
jgi:NTP pyrophosphatase (non-canonical NTP hydrolase)